MFALATLLVWPHQTAIAQTSLTNGLLAYWSFDNGTATNPISANYQGVLKGDFTVVNGYSGKALRFNGTNTSISFGSKPYLPRLTLSMFVLVDTQFLNAPYPATLAYEWGDGENFRVLAGNEGGSFRFNASFHAAPWPLSGSMYPEQGVVATSTFPAGHFHHVAIAYDGDYLKLYVDGQYNNQSATVKNPYAASIPSGIPFTLGSQSGGGWPFNGIIDEVLLFDRALSDAEIILLYAPVVSITDEPRDAYALPGGTASFSVAARSSGFVLTSGPLSYQWLLNGVPIAEATNSVLNLANVQSTNAGTYGVIVQNPTGTSVTSSNAALTIVTPGLDDDHDGLLNETEVQLGTNPLKPDTDGDGLNDYDELFAYATGPLKADTDGDDVPDGWEVQHGLNPLANDAARIGPAGVSNLQVYQYDLAHPNPVDQLDPRNPFFAPGTSVYEALNNGQHTNRFYYDKNDRLVGMESSRGISLAYTYDGNGNLVRQTVLSRASETNGLPVLWQFLHGLTNGTPSDGPYGDADGDGWSNYQEWLADTDPIEANSAPNLLGNPGKNIASLALPFTPSNFVVGVGQLDGQGAEEIVIGGDGDPGTNVNWLLVLTQTGTSWSTQRVDIGSFGVTSLAIGQVTNRPGPAIYAGLRQAGGTGRIVELLNSGGVWQTNMVATSINEAGFVLGVRGRDLLVSLATTNAADGSLSSLTFRTNWFRSLVDTNTSHRGLGTIASASSTAVESLRLLDTGGIQLGVAANAQGLVGHYSLDANGQDSSGNQNHAQVFGGNWTTNRFGESASALALAGTVNDYVIINPFTNFPTSTITVSIFIKTLVSPDQATVLSYATSAANNNEFLLNYPANLNIVAHNVSQFSGVSVKDGSWHHVAATWRSSDGECRLYKDGALVFTGMLTPGSPLQAGGSVVFGNDQDSVGGAFDPNESFQGALDDILIYNRVLDWAEIASLSTSSGGGAGVTVSEPSVSRASDLRGYSLASGSLHGTNGLSIFYTFADDKNVCGSIDTGDDFVTAEYLMSGTNASLLTLSRTPIAALTPAQSYGLACVNFLNASNEVFFTGEPDGQVFAWTASNATNPLQRQLFSAHHFGKAWHALAGVKTLEPGEALAGLRVDPAMPNRCDVILWPPQESLPNLRSLPETAPAAAVLPSANPLGNFAALNVRLWDAEGNAATPFLQYQLAGSTNWQDATLLALDGAAYSAATRVTALPGGSDHTLVWNALTDLGAGVTTNVLLRTRARDFMLLGDWSLPTPFQVATIENPDANGNGIPDGWELQHFGNLDQPADGDFDGDAFSNRAEYLAGTDPEDPQSSLRITAIEIEAGGVHLTWKAGSTVPQYLQRSADPSDPNGWQNIFTNSAPMAGEFLDAAPNAAQFYRVKIGE